MDKIQVMRGLREAYKAKEAIFAHKRWATEDEGEILYNIATENHITRVVEIGTANGWTAAWFALAGADVLTFDIVSRPKMYLDSLFPYPQLVSQIKFTQCASPRCLEEVPPYTKPTLYFIDADHSYNAAKVDHDAVVAVAKPGDLIAHHDVGAEVGSARLWAELVAANPETTHFYKSRNGVGLLRL